MTSGRIALISTTPKAVPPAAAAVGAALPEATVWNLIDDRLLADATAEGGVTPSLGERMDRLIDLAVAGGADGVLLTCSQFGGRARIRDPRRDGVAVLAADDPLFAEVAAAAPETVVVVASLASSAADSTARLGAYLTEAGAGAELVTVVAEDAATTDDPALVTRELTDAVAAVGVPYDLIVLAQYSLAPAAEALAERFGTPVLDGPSAAARRLAQSLETRA
ncbi:hypothetical protein [Streptomyces nanshensis]|uniref:Arylsulfatase n=1 Tax=Streptomyces nanshensis TaxID=518642 RepID=A0A1E7L8C6_9ACTN|nr:hypothetical protein [Streptomyces nanshensis]OEV12408.1 hypothetical protein AN218_08550 [Streptomyces nanshensis]